MTNLDYVHRFQESYGESFTSLRIKYSLTKNILPYMIKMPFRAMIIAFAIVLMVVGCAVIFGANITFAQIVGAAGLIMARESAFFKEHRHILAVASTSCTLSATQQGLMIIAGGDPGSYIPGIAMLGHAAITTGAFAIVPEHRIVVRRTILWGGAILGVVMAIGFAYSYQNDWGVIPALTTIGNAVLFSVSDKYTPRARLGYIAMNVFHMLFWATQPVVSVWLFLIEIMYVATHSVSLMEHDIPIADRHTGKEYSPSARWKLYFTQVLVNGEIAQKLGLTRYELGWVRPDEKLYGGIWKKSLGI